MAANDVAVRFILAQYGIEDIFLVRPLPQSANIWYVRKTGNDSNSGALASQAWLTIGKALTTASAGDTIYVGAGIYRETVVVTASGSAGLVISVIGDVDGAQTGDAGEVQWTAYTTNDKTAPSASALCALGGHSYFAFSLLTMIGGSGGTVSTTTNNGGHDYTFTDCVFINILGSNPLLFYTPNNGTPSNITFDRCAILSSQGSGIAPNLVTTASGSADFDANVIVRNCLILSNSNPCVEVFGVGAAAHHGGGVRVYNCTLIGSIGLYSPNTTVSTTIPCEIHNSVVFGGAIGLQANTSGQITEDHNLIFSATPRTNVTAGTGSISDGSYAPLLDIGQQYKWAGLDRRFLSPSSAVSPILGFGSGGVTQTVDWQNRPRPAGGQSGSTAAGYIEYHDSAVRDTVLFDVAPSSAKLVGPGDINLRVPVNAVKTTLSVKVYLTAYTGTNYPQAVLLGNGEIGVTAQTVSASSTTGSWQTLTFVAFTPTATGWVDLRLVSYTTGATDQVNFDTITVS